MSLVYKTLELPCDREYNGEPLNFTGIRTIKLTNRPANVNVWISGENTGQNLFPLINRGDGWVNLDEPLNNCYIYTSGLNNAGDMLQLNITGQKDIFQYGTSSVERIGNVHELYMLQNISPNILSQLAKGFQNLYYKPPTASLRIQGEATKLWTKGQKIFFLPQSIDKGIKDLNFKNDKYYRIEVIGHYDAGGLINDNNGWRTSVANHLCLFNNTNEAIFTLESGAKIDIDNCYLANKTPWITEKTDLFDFYGFLNVFTMATQSGTFGAIKTLEYGYNNVNKIVLKGDFLNSFEKIGLCITVIYNAGGAFGVHTSLFINFYELETLENA